MNDFQKMVTYLISDLGKVRFVYQISPFEWHKDSYKSIFDIRDVALPFDLKEKNFFCLLNSTHVNSVKAQFVLHTSVAITSHQRDLISSACIHLHFHHTDGTIATGNWGLFQ